jgi:hypothetical protein
MTGARTTTAARFTKIILRTMAALVVGLSVDVAAEETSPPSLPALWAAQQNDAIFAPVAAQPVASASTADGESRIEANKSYAIPALEIVLFDVLVNLANRYTTGDPYHSNLASIRHNLHHSWVVDNDPFKVNQFWHPYQGSMYHGFPRSAGLDFWPSLGYTFAGSALLGNRQRDNPAVAKRSERQRRRGQLPQRGAVPDGEPPARARRRSTRSVARDRRGRDLSRDRFQPARFRRSLQGDLSEPRSGLLQPRRRGLRGHDPERAGARPRG